MYNPDCLRASRIVEKGGATLLETATHYTTGERIDLYQAIEFYTSVNGGFYILTMYGVRISRPNADPFYRWSYKRSRAERWYDTLTQ